MIKSHPHLLSLIDSLKLEQSNTENLYFKLSTCQENKRKPGYVYLEDKLNQAISDFDSLKILIYLKKFSQDASQAKSYLKRKKFMCLCSDFF